jgi:hypothetical protein
MTQTQEYSAEDVLRIAEAYAHEDDWSVRGVYVGTLRDLVRGGQKAGYLADEIVRHAKHTGRYCCRIGSAETKRRERAYARLQREAQS